MGIREGAVSIVLHAVNKHKAEGFSRSGVRRDMWMINCIPSDLKSLIKTYSCSRGKNNLAQAAHTGSSCPAQGRSAVTCPGGV